MGHRMDSAMRVLPAGPAVIVGVDIPDLDISHVMRACAALERHDAVFGSAEDGAATGSWGFGVAGRCHISSTESVGRASIHLLTLLQISNREVAMR